MSELRSGNQQLNEEIHNLYHSMTDPREIEKRQQKEAAQERIKIKRKRYGV